MKSLAFLPISNVVYSAPFTQSPGISTLSGKASSFRAVLKSVVQHLFSWNPHYSKGRTKIQENVQNLQPGKIESLTEIRWC